MSVVSIDFETRSIVELKATGVYPYAKHPSTSLWCMAYAFDDEEPVLWFPGEPFPERLMLHIAQGGELRAWNAQFERIMWRDCCQRLYNFPVVQLEQWVDTAAEAAAMALPRGLDQCAKVTGVKHQKDGEGYSLMLRMCRPRKINEDGSLVWWDVPDRVKRLAEYCLQDVRTERDIARVLRHLSAEEREVYLLDQRINDRGVLLDTQLVDAARALVEEGLGRANGEIERITEGDVSAVTQHARITRWLQAEGLEVESIRKGAVTDLLAGELKPHVRAVLQVRQEAGRSSVAKLESMRLVADVDDNRLRGLLLYHGAATGRWSGKLVQPQNFPRGEVDDIERYIETVREGAEAYDLLDCMQSPMTVVSSMLRSMIVAAPGHRLLVGDFTAIEARVLNWLAGQDDVTAQFARYDQTKAKADDAYVLNAVRIFRIPLKDVQKFPHRQTGKFQELGCGYQMGWKKALTAAKDVYGVDLVAMYGQEEAEELAQYIVNEYRNRHTEVVDYWYDCERAARDAVREPGKVFTAGAEGRQVRFAVSGRYLWLRLPGNRLLCYAAPKLVERETPWGDLKTAVESWGVNSMTRKWESRTMYGGLWVENIVQAVSRDLMVQAMLRLEKAGYTNVLTVHDEIVAEVPEGVGTVAEFEKLMAECPEWARGCPVGTEAWEGARYRK
jgi:DNA polymerase